MNTFEINDMTCGHCVGTITRAVKAVDADAKLHFDLAKHRVEITANDSDARHWADVIKQAGYTPVAVSVSVAVETAARPDVQAAAPKRSGCCCG